jgi:MFS family permease
MNFKIITGTFRALKYRNYRLFFIGQGISLIGTWMQQLALSWLIYRLTNSAFMLGVVGFCSQVPSLFIFSFAGTIADRKDKRKLLIATQGLALIQAMTLAVLVLSNNIAIWQIVVLSLIMGIINAFDMPFRQSFVVDTIDRREDLSNAIALNSSLFNGARLIGPTIAGALIPFLGEGLCFLLNGISYIAVIFSLFRISVTPRRHNKNKGNPLPEIIAGIKYTLGFPPTRSIILLIALISFSSVPYMVLMPVFAKTLLHGGAHTLGLLTGLSGFGALAGALYLASRKTVIGLIRIISMTSVSLGICLCLFSVSRILPLSLFFAALIGFNMITMMASCNTVLQTIVDDSMRGRVMAFYNVAFMGCAPFGSLAAGALSEKLGPTIAVIIFGCFSVISASIFIINIPLIKKLMRPIYIKKGIIPEIAEGIQNADFVNALRKE